MDDSLKDAGNTGFKSSNYDISLHQGTHTVKKRTVRATVSGSQVYGESAPKDGEAYEIAFEMAGGKDVDAHEGLVNDQTIADSQVTVDNSVGKRTMSAPIRPPSRTSARKLPMVQIIQSASKEGSGHLWPHCGG